MSNNDLDREYIDVVVVTVNHLLNMDRVREDVGEYTVEKAIQAIKAMNTDVIDNERLDWLRKDVKFVIDGFWDVLKDKRNRGRRDEIIRGALR